MVTISIPECQVSYVYMQMQMSACHNTRHALFRLLSTETGHNFNRVAEIKQINP